LPDLIAFILSALELLDLLASAVACRSWHATYKADPWIGAASFFHGPCLVFHSDVDCDAPVSEASLRSLTDGAAGRVHLITLPDPPFAMHYVMGSSHGRLSTADEKSDLLVVNPVTHALPLIYSPRHVTCSFNQGILKWYRVHGVDFFGSVHRFSFYEVTWSSDPTSGNCIVMIMQFFQRVLSFARVGDAR
jgi:hypothetical protein